ncbi:MAG: acyltransferase [Thermodesulfobacteriota bacterium]
MSKDGELGRILLFLRYELPLWMIALLTNWLPEFTPACRLRGFLSRPFLGRCGKNFAYGARVRFLAPWGIEVGKDVYVASGCWLSGGAKLVLEDEILIGPYSIIATGSHRMKGESFRFAGFDRQPVWIGRGTWIGAHVLVTPGVRIGKANLISGAAVVTKSTPDHVMMAGVPARVIRDLSGKGGKNQWAELQR